MRIDKSIKAMPWPEPYKTAGNQDFAITLSWPTVNHERLLVATFSANREKKRWRGPGPDFRLVCSKKNNTAAVLYKGDRAGKRHNLRKALDTFVCNPDSCYPEITEQDEIALAKFLRRRGTNNHLMPELATWVADAQAAETLAERDARGELRDEDVDLCPDELPAGLVDYIRREVLPTDNVLIYKKGNVRGTCYCCGRKVKAQHPQRFTQNETVQCPECGATVRCFLDGSDRFKVDYVDDIATIQKGIDGATLFIRQWHLCRDPKATWEDIPAQLDEVARYAVRGNKAAKWQREAKENWYMNTYRYRLDKWTRVENVTYIYDGQYFFWTPEDWREQLQGTSLQYCDLGGYAEDAAANGRDRNTIRFLLDWPRYPAIEKLWKAGYTGLIHERIRGTWKRHQHAVIWTRDSIQSAIRFPFRLLKALPPAEWTMDKMQETAEAWAMCEMGRIREKEIAELVAIPCSIGDVQQAIGHASVHKIAAYVEKIIAKERAERAKAKAKAAAEGTHYWGTDYPYRAPQTYRDYLQECAQLALDLDDPAVLFPRDLDAAHQRTTAQIKHKVSEEQKAAFLERVKTLARLEWQKAGLIIRLPASADELTAEGAALHHCVGGYVGQVVAGTTTILFIREKANPDKPFYTLEWRDGKVIQCRTDNNKPHTQDERVAAFVDAWVQHITKKAKKKTKAAAAA